MSKQPAIASSTPVWTFLDPYIFQTDGDEPFPTATGDPTAASSINSRGDEIRVCVRLEEPPRPSRIIVDWRGLRDQTGRFFVVAAHRDAVLCQISYTDAVPGHEPFPQHEYFIYRPGASPPSLHLLPSIDGGLDDLRALIDSGRYFTKQRLRRIDCLDIGMLCHLGGKDDEGEIVVAELETYMDAPPELHILRYGRSSKPLRSDVKWELKHPQVTFHGNSEMDLETLTWLWSPDKVIPAGTALLWVDYCLPGLLYCNMFDGSLDKGTINLHYVPLPAKLHDLMRTAPAHSYPVLYNGVSFSEEHSVVKFIMVSDANDDQMVTYRFGQAADFKVSSWSLKIPATSEISAAKMVWELDAVVTSGELWKLDGFEKVPCVPLEYPLVSMVDPSIVYFVLREVGKELELEYPCQRTWLVAIDMQHKSLESLFAYIDGGKDEPSPQEKDFIYNKYRYFEPFILPSFLSS